MELVRESPTLLRTHPPLFIQLSKYRITTLSCSYTKIK